MPTDLPDREAVASPFADWPRGWEVVYQCGHSDEAFIADGDLDLRPATRYCELHFEEVAIEWWPLSTLLVPAEYVEGAEQAAHVTRLWAESIGLDDAGQVSALGPFEFELMASGWIRKLGMMEGRRRFYLVRVTQAGN